MHLPSFPKGSMYPNSIYLSLKVVSILVLWGQGMYYLGTWILWVCVQGSRRAPPHPPPTSGLASLYASCTTTHSVLWVSAAFVCDASSFASFSCSWHTSACCLNLEPSQLPSPSPASFPMIALCWHSTTWTSAAAAVPIRVPPLLAPTPPQQRQHVLLLRRGRLQLLLLLLLLLLLPTSPPPALLLLLSCHGCKPFGSTSRTRTLPDHKKT